MPAVTIRNLSKETHRALKHRAALHGSSTEAEIRLILEETVRPNTRVKIGTELAEFGKSLRHALKTDRDSRPTEPAVFD
ncbi:FitA-like ribbon-helix-helix domain-containing protein [Granulicella arctica]|uniref:Plasmid stability protein n=1 Tax=Granulicella arctica TaxID=940613 RepID=A0A7Y9TFB4_9BACT|nr:plasmid stability protein [Granulicella arctica]NYF78159.1 plasmid stability protein [Granulicella arctica]